MKRIDRNKKRPGFFKRMIGDYDEQDDEVESVEDEYADDDSFEDDVEDELENEFEDEDGEEIENVQETQGLVVDLIDKGESILARTPVPGASLEDISISLTRENLSVEVNTNECYEESDGDYIFREIFAGRMTRSEMLPEEVDVDNTTAEIKDGMLAITMPKLDKKKKANISVRKR